MEGGVDAFHARRGGPRILQCAGEHRMRVAVGRGVEIAGQYHRHIVRQRRQVARDGLRALQARGFILVAVRQVGVEQVEAPAVAALFEQCPRHHAGMGVAPGDAARHVGRVGQPEVAGLDDLQPILPVEHAHVFAAAIGLAPAAEPGVLRQFACQVVGLRLHQFLQADHVGLLLAQHAHGEWFARLPVIHAVALRGQADVEAHHRKRIGGTCLHRREAQQACQHQTPTAHERFHDGGPPLSRSDA